MSAILRLGVTGTDTGVGKTRVAAGLVAALRARGVRVAGMKPVETGVDGGAPPRFHHAPDSPIAQPQDPASMGGIARTDAELLRAAAGDRLPLDLVRPVSYAEPLAPLVAARRAGVPVDLARLDAAFAAMAADHDALIVEGAGGLMVPVADGLDVGGLFARWGLDLLVVAGNRLGCINHALLTVARARDAGLHVRALVLSELLPPAARDVAARTNLDVLRELLPDIPVRTFPFVAAPQDVAALADGAREAGLDALLAPAAAALPDSPHT